MSVGENFPGSDPFNDDPVLRALNAELDLFGQTVSNGDVAYDRLMGAEPLITFADVAPDVPIVVEFEEPFVGTDRMLFVKARGAEAATSGWRWFSGERGARKLVPVELAGSHVAGTPFGDPDHIRRGQPLSFYEVVTFRSGADWQYRHGSPCNLPAPELLDKVTFLRMLKEGFVVCGPDSHWYWRFPGQVFDTPPVVDARQVDLSTY